MASVCVLQAAVYDGWTYRLKIRFAAPIQGTLTNIPVLVILSTNSISGFRYTDFSSPASGADIRFANSNETTALNFEFQKWNTNGSSYIWVNVPRIASTNDFIYAYWQKSGATAPACTTNGATWTNGFAGVWHLDESSGNALDCTTNKYNGVVTGASRGASGKILDAYSFDGSSDYVGITLNPGPTVTISAWASSSAGTPDDMLWCVRGGNPGPDLFYCSGNIYLNTWDGTGNPFCAQPSPMSTLRHYTAVISSGRTELYINGRRAGTAAYRDPSASPFYISSAAGYDWQGVIDEFTLSRTARASNWVYACYLNQASNSVFCNYGTVGTQSKPVIHNHTPTNVTAASAWLNGHLVSTGQSPVTVSVYWGDNDGGAPTSGLWDATNKWAQGAWLQNSTPTYQATTLTANKFYFYRYYGTNAGGHGWAETTERFLAGNITVTAPDASATESVAGTDTATFTIQRAAAATNYALTVSYSFGGTAVYGVDYTANPAGTSVTLPAGVASTNIKITALWDIYTNESAETVSLALQPGSYGLGSPASNTASIANVIEQPYGSWQYRTKITYIAPINESFSDFTALVMLGTNIPGFAYTQFVSRATGADMRFAASDKLTPLNYEIEKWDTNGTSLVWVRIPALSQGKYIYGYWGKAGVSALPCNTNGTTWSSSYRSVWHLKETSGTDYYDSTTNRINGTKSGNTAPSTAGAVNGAQTFDGSADYIDFATPASLDIALPRTVSAWIKPAAMVQYGAIVGKDSQRSGSSYSYMMCCHNDGSLIAYDGGSWRQTAALGITAGNWYHVAYVTPGDGYIYFYLNGNPVGTVAWTHNDNPAHNAYIGSWYSPGTGYDFNGTIDEARIEPVARSANWINACHMNVRNQGTFFRYGASLKQAQLNVEVYAATDIGSYNAVANGEVATTNSLPTASVYVCWDFSDKGTTATSSWANVAYVGSYGPETAFTKTMTGLLPNSNYVYRCYATNAAGGAWSTVLRSFRACRAWYVSSGGSGVDGKSWASAYNTIQIALNAATNGAELIHVKGETFTLTTPLSWTKPGVILRGGYQGSGTPGSQNPSTWPTVIKRSTSVTNRIATIVNAANGKLESVTIAGGLLTASWSVGGGLYITNSSGFTIDSCIITNNRAGALGGGIYALNNSLMSIKNSTIISNIMDVTDRDWVRYGGGLYLAGSSGTMSNCVVRGNVSRNTIHGWSVTRPNGAGIVLDGGAMTVVRTVVQNNRVWNPNQWEVTMYGGGVYVAGGSHTLRNCLIKTNEVVSVTSGTEQGEGVYVAGGSLLVDNCTIVDNNNEGVREYAGSATLTVSNSIIYGHTVRDVGGAIDAYYSCIGDGTKAGQYGCFSNNPAFVDKTYYHVKSVYSNYVNGYFSGGSWATSTTNSRCIDKGSPTAACSAEPHPNGARLNIGAYGNTAVASKSPPLAVRVLAPNAVTPTSATFNAEVLLPGSPNVKIWFYWGFTNGYTTASQWKTNAYTGIVPSTGSISRAVAGLLSNSNYYYTIFASNSAGATAWAVPSTNFTAVAYPPEIANRGVLNEFGPTVTLKGELLSAGGLNTRVFVCWGPVDGGAASTANWQNVVNCGLKTVGNFQVNITTASGSNYYYACYATNAVGTEWAEPSIPFGHAIIRYVSSTATGRATGYNWTDAFPAIDTALSGCIAGRTNIIYIKGGNYPIDIQLAMNKSNVRMLGSYQGTGFPGNYSLTTWPTVVKRNGSAVTRLLFINGTTNCTVRAVKFQGGYREGSSNPDGSGGALYILNSAGLKLDTCIFRNNWCYLNMWNGGDIFGGAIYSVNSSVNMSDSTVISNKATTLSSSNIQYANGGGIAVGSGTWNITNCVVSANFLSADYLWGYVRGAGLYLNGTVNVANSVIMRNDAGEPSSDGRQVGDGVHVAGGTAIFRNSIIAQNCGPGPENSQNINFYADGAAVCKLLNCTVVSNRQYGVIQAGSSTITVTNSIISDNVDDIYQTVAGNTKLYYTTVQDGDSNGADGCNTNDPQFVDSTYYHVKSPYGQYEGGYFSGGSWGTGATLSPAIDTCATNIVPTMEPQPDGGIVNRGAYGNTSVASKSNPIGVTNRAATAVTTNAATLNGRLLYVGTRPVSVWFYYGQTDKTNDKLAWATSTYVGQMNYPGLFSKRVTGLVKDATYYFRAYVSNAVGATAWGEPSRSFVATISPPEVVNDGVLNEFGPAVTLKGRVVSDGGANTRVFVCWGPNSGNTSSTSSWANVINVGIQTGAFSTIVSTASGSNYFYTCVSTNVVGTGWATPVLPFGYYAIWYVNKDATGLANGYSWSNAFTSIQTALNAYRSGRTNIIYIRGQTFVLPAQLSINNSYIQLRGGYQGTSGTPGTRSSSTWPTILTNQGGTIRFMTISGATNILVEDMTLTGASAPGNGGGAYVQNSTGIRFRRCSIVGNTALQYGAGLYLNTVAAPVVEDCTIRANTLNRNSGNTYGGGIYALNCTAGVVTNTLIDHNLIYGWEAYDYGEGSGLFLNGGSWRIHGSAIRYNRLYCTYYGRTYGAGIFAENGTHVVTNCIIAQNHSEGTQY